MPLNTWSASAEDNNPFTWADERFASAATWLSCFTSTENGSFFWNHVLLLFPSSIHSFGFATRLQTNMETNYPLALATCKTHFHLGKTKKHMQLESIIISDDTPSSPSSNSTVLSQQLRSGKCTSRCLLRGHRWSLLIISFWTQRSIFTQTPEREKLYQAEQEKYQTLDASQESNNFNSKELSDFQAHDHSLPENPAKSFPRPTQAPPSPAHWL